MSRRRKVLLIVAVLLWVGVDLSFILVVPVFAAMFADFGGPLPGLTQALIDLAWFSRSHSVFYWPLFYGALAGSAYIAVRKEKRLFAMLFVASSFLAVGMLIVALFLPVFDLGTTAPK